MHLNESKVFQYFGSTSNTICQLPMLFTQVVKVTNHTILWDNRLAWYSLSATHLIFFHCLEHGFGIHDLGPTWSCLIVEVLVNPAKIIFSHLVSGFRSTGPSPLTQQKVLVPSAVLRPTSKSKCPELDYAARSSVSLSNQTWSKVMHNMSAHYLPWYDQPKLS